jgi:hypothetical protein
MERYFLAQISFQAVITNEQYHIMLSKILNWTDLIFLFFLLVITFISLFLFTSSFSSSNFINLFHFVKFLFFIIYKIN